MWRQEQSWGHGHDLEPDSWTNCTTAATVGQTGLFLSTNMGAKPLPALHMSHLLGCSWPTPGRKGRNYSSFCHLFLHARKEIPAMTPRQSWDCPPCSHIFTQWTCPCQQDRAVVGPPAGALVGSSRWNIHRDGIYTGTGWQIHRGIIRIAAVHLCLRGYHAVPLPSLGSLSLSFHVVRACRCPPGTC